jgi:hypothetical protein
MNRKLSITVLMALFLIAGQSFSAQKKAGQNASKKKNAGAIAQQVQESKPQNIIVIGWDGSQRDHVKEMIGRNELPRLAALSQEGKMIDIDVTDGATDTKAGWSQILTGYSCEITGVNNNSNYQPIPEGYSVFERLEKFFGPENIDTVAVIGKKAHVDNDAPKKVDYDKWQANEKKQATINKKAAGLGNLQGGKIVEEDGKKFVETPGKPWYIASQHMDLFENGLLENQKVATRAIEELEKRKDRRFFFFVHFANPDHDGHKFGENSQEYTDALKSDDEWTGKIIEKVKDMGIYNNTLIYVVVDHGFNEGQKGHSYAPYVFLATNDKSVNRDGDRMDIAPTVLKRFGLDLSAMEPKLSGTPLDEPAERKAAPAEKPARLTKKAKEIKVKEKSADQEQQPAKKKVKDKKVQKDAAYE